MNPSSPFESLYQEELYVLSPKILIVLSKNWSELLEEDQLLLSKILGSVKLTLARVQVVTQQEFELKDLAAYSPKQIICFGSTLRGARQQYQLLSIEGTSVLQADPLHKLDDAKKKNLWNGLKLMFNL